jgi:hypothetical protein
MLVRRSSSTCALTHSLPPPNANLTACSLPYIRCSTRTWHGGLPTTTSFKVPSDAPVPDAPSCASDDDARTHRSQLASMSWSLLPYMPPHRSRPLEVDRLRLGESTRSSERAKPKKRVFSRFKGRGSVRCKFARVGLKRWPHWGFSLTLACAPVNGSSVGR